MVTQMRYTVYQILLKSNENYSSYRLDTKQYLSYQIWRLLLKNWLQECQKYINHMIGHYVDI